MASEDTRERLLNAAEQLFAERGISGTTLRALTKAAKVNLAAVHYHFGSKEGLLDAVVERRATAMNQERLRELDELERSAGEGAPQVEDILRAFFLPGLRSLREGGAGDHRAPDTAERPHHLRATRGDRGAGSQALRRGDEALRRGAAARSPGSCARRWWTIASAS